MNAFITKQDWFELAGENLVCMSSDDGNSNEVAEATGQDGAVVAYNVYGEKLAPSNEYALQTSTWTKEEGDLKLGSITAIKVGEIGEGSSKVDDIRSICLNSLEISTSAGAAPTINVSGEQVEKDAEPKCTFSLPAISLSKKHHAQILMNAFASNVGTNCHLKSASYSFSASVTKAEVEGVCLTHDVVEGKIECSVEILQVGEAKPELTMIENSGWVVTAVLACSNPDSDWPSWSATLTKYLVKDAD